MAGNLAPVTCLIGIGSNIAPEENLPRGVQLLSQAVEVLRHSQVWRTPAIGTAGPDFLNAAILVKTDLPAAELKDRVLRPIEAALGRVRGEDKYAPRPIDLDIVVYAGQVLDAELWTQAHVAVPAAELCPQITHPDSGVSLKEHAQNLSAGKDLHRITGIF